MSETLDLKALTPEQREELKAELKQQEMQEKENAEKEKANYKTMVGEIVDEYFTELNSISKALSDQKKKIYDSFNTAIAMKKELFKVKEGQNCNTFMNAEGTKRITLGYCVKDAYDDTVNEGIEKVKEYIYSLAEGEKTQQLIETVMQLLSKDKKGNIKPSKVVLLSNLADKYDDPLFKEGVQIIKSAYKPEYSKQFVRAETKNEQGAWINVPLGMTEC
jgi:Protein of unknown function (DUF3164).